jgi:hypothetical protein
MPLLEIVQTHQVSATIRLDQTTAEQIDQYAAFLHVSADDVVDKALAYVFAKDRDFQDYLRRAFVFVAHLRMAMVQSLSRVVPSLQERWMPPVIRAHAAGMERFDARSVLRTGFISTLHP